MENQQDTCALKTEVRKVMHSHFRGEFFPLLSREDAEQELWLTAWTAQKKNPALSYIHGAIRNRCHSLIRGHFTECRHPRGYYGEPLTAAWVNPDVVELSAPDAIERVEARIALDSLFESTAPGALQNALEYTEWRSTR